MVFETTKYKYDTIRIFYGLKNNGRGFFINNKTKEEDYYYQMYVKDQTYADEKCESANLVIKESNGNNSMEYLISIPKEKTYVEIYDFDNNSIYQKYIDDFTKKSSIYSFRHAVIPLKPNNFQYYYLFGFIAKNPENLSSYRYIIQKHKFNSILNFSNENTIIEDKIKNGINAFFHYSGVSCFQTLNKYIICFFLSDSNKYIITAFDENLEELQSISIDFLNKKVENPFYKCIYLKEEMGVFSYYLYNNARSFFYIVFTFKEYICK